MAGRMQLGEKATEAMAGRIEAAPGQRHAKSIVCTVCDNPAFENPVKTAVCAHLFHRQCLEQWIQGKHGDAHNCPLCRQVLPTGAAYTEADRYVRVILAELEVDCPQDCAAPNPKRMRYEQLAVHIRACPLTPMLCGNTGCGAVVPQKDIEAHAAECEHALAAGDARGLRPAQHGAPLDLLTAQEHKASECPRRRYQCTYCQKKNIIYSSKEAHERQDCTGQVPVGWVADLRQQNKALGEQNGQLKEANRELKEEIQELRKGHVDEIKKVQQFMASLCPRIKVASTERQRCSGEYNIAPEEVNGCRVWARAPSFYVYKTTLGHWMITDEHGDMAQGVGVLSSHEKSDAPYPIAVSNWSVVPFGIDGWAPAPGTTVTAVAAL